MSLNRRDFLRGALLAGGGLCLPGLSLHFAHAAVPGRHGCVLAIFLRGGADGLNIVVPHGDADYYRLRPTLGLPRPEVADGVLDLDGYFGLHPALAPLQPLYAGGEVALVHACGAVHGSRSHFDAQELMERGVVDKRGAPSGWLGRAVESLPGAGSDPFVAVGMGNAVARALGGAVPAMGIASLDGFGLASRETETEAVRYALARAFTGESAVAATARQALEAIDLLALADPAQHATDPAAQYPATPFGELLRQLAQLIKSNLGLRAASVDLGGWDHHDSEAPQLQTLLDQLARALLAFYTDLGPLASEVGVVTMSEFGRRAFENGSSGTDHGAGNLMLLLGGGVRGGQVYADWPGLSDAALDRGDLRITTDYRQVLAELVARQLPEADLDYMLQDYAGGPALGLYG